MLIYPVLLTSESQAKISVRSKDGHAAHFWPPYNILKPNLHMKPNNNILVTFSTLKRQTDHIMKPENILQYLKFPSHVWPSTSPLLKR